MPLFVVIHDEIVRAGIELEVLLIIFVQFGLKLFKLPKWYIPLSSEFPLELL